VSLQGAVGRAGKNRADDVRRVQAALKAWRLYKGPLSGTPSEDLTRAIDTFQRQIGLSRPDGRIDPGGFTERHLLGKPPLYFMPLRVTSRYGAMTSRRPFPSVDRAPGLSPPTDTERRRTVPRLAARRPADIGGNRRCVEMIAPAVAGRYTIEFAREPLFYPANARPSSASLARALRGQRLKPLVDFTVRTDAPYGVRPFALYLQVNGDVPATGGRASPTGGYSQKPIVFSWFTREKEGGPKDTYDGVEFRYRLSPVESGWSPWRKTRSVPYYFIMPGRHSFEVEARYTGQDGKWRSGGFTLFDFTLQTAFVSRPKIAAVAKSDKSSGPAKGFVPVVSAADRNLLTRIYPKSRAFLAGVQVYDDPNLAPLPFVDRDLAALKKALGALQFDVSHAYENTTRADLTKGLEAFIKTVNKGDRVLLYFSMHGFQDNDALSRAYVAPKDCQVEAPSVYCVPLAMLREYVVRLNRRGARHVVVILDTCSAGLGIIEKSARMPFFEMKMAEATGAHMITAGLADQKALMDNETLKMSLFTHFLVKGLDGTADLTNDGVTSLSELLVYVRGEVARVSNGSQTPMMGRLAGSGEMVFLVGKP
jgi:hypothetical protein